MTIDLAIGIIAITVLSVLAFAAGRRTSEQLRSMRPMCFAISLLVTLLFAWALSGKLLWATVFPTGAAIFWSNLMPPLLSFAAGLSSRTPGLTHWHRPATVIALSSLALAYTMTPILRPLLVPAKVASVTQWRGDVCLQSHPSTCAPAAAVTLLRLAGVESEEWNLAEACLTSCHGTVPLGLFRGLSTATHGVALQPSVASSHPEQWNAGGQLPNIALVRFPHMRGHGSLKRLLGPRGEGHAIVVLDRLSDGNWLIADPAFGNATWSDQAFRDRFTGDAIYLAANDG